MNDTTLISNGERPAFSVLLVEDQLLVRRALKGTLKDEGYQVTEAIDGEPALDLLASRSFDLVIADIWLPKVDGIEVLKYCKEHYHDMPVIIISGGGSNLPLETRANVAEANGADAVLYKPFDDVHLLDAMTRLLRGRSARS